MMFDLESSILIQIRLISFVFEIWRSYFLDMLLSCHGETGGLTMLADRASEIAKEMAALQEEEIMIHRDVFNIWLRDPDMLGMLINVEC